MTFTLTLAQAYWNQRFRIRDCKDRWRRIGEAVGWHNDLTLNQWAQFAAFTLEYQPELIVELGRGHGNSTCVFLEASRLLGGVEQCKLLSLCLSSSFEQSTLPNLKRIDFLDAQWFAPLRLINANILTVPYEQIFSPFKRILLLWDAHGFTIANCVLGKILPLLKEKEHQVIMHDMSDLRYLDETARDYKDRPIWSGNNDDNRRLCIGYIDSAVEQSISIMDFTTRNRMELVSADHSFHTEIGTDESKMQEMKDLLGDEFFSLNGHWFWFSLNDYPGPFTFPKYLPPNEWK